MLLKLGTALSGLIAGTSVVQDPSGAVPAWAYMAAALFGSGLITAWFNARRDRRTGSSAAAASEDVAQGAQMIVDTSERLMAPLRARLDELQATNGDLNHELGASKQREAAREVEIAEASRELVLAAQISSKERHDQNGQIALLGVEVANAHSEIVRLEEEIAALKARTGDADRRARDRRDRPDLA